MFRRESERTTRLRERHETVLRWLLAATVAAYALTWLLLRLAGGR